MIIAKQNQKRVHLYQFMMMIQIISYEIVLPTNAFGWEPSELLLERMFGNGQMDLLGIIQIGLKTNLMGRVMEKIMFICMREELLLLDSGMMSRIHNNILLYVNIIR